MQADALEAAKTTRRATSAPGKKRVLLTNAFGPYDLVWGTAPTDLYGARLARGDSVFHMSSRQPTSALYLLAENVSHPCTVLEFPRWEDFVRELESGYDVIAIQLMSLHTARVAKMIAEIRRRSPGTTIVIGGYGVSALEVGMPGDKEGHARYILDNADHLCRAEGVRFMRELLDDAPVDRPITQYHIPPATTHPYGNTAITLQFPTILVSLGCPSACNFCNTSAFFFHRKYRVAEPEQIYDYMKYHQSILGRDRITFTLYDEDIFMDPDLVRELGRLIRSDRSTWGFRWSAFGSMRSLSPFDAVELRECGVDSIWIGFESGIEEEGRRKAGFAKLSSTISPQQRFDELRGAGISTIGSMILGLDFHTPDNIEQDIDSFVELRSTFYQIGPLQPCPGTRLYKELQDEGRINETFDWGDFHLWNDGSHQLKHLAKSDVRKYYDLAHERLRTRNGSPALQIFEGNLLAYEQFKDADSEFLRYHAQLSLDRIRDLYPVARACERHPPSEEARERARNLRRQAEQLLRGDRPRAKAYRFIASQVAGWRMRRPLPPPPPAYAPPMACVRFHEPGQTDPMVQTAA